MELKEFYSICNNFEKRIKIKLIKRISQHFLLDCNSIKFFYNQLLQFKNYDFLEVGTGIGSITIPLSILAKRIITIEIDRRLSYVRNFLPHNVEFIIGDGASFVDSTKIPILVSNMPYNITSKILITLAKNNNIKYAVLGMQKEVGKRITANPGEESYGRLSIIIQLLFKTKIVGYIPSEKFFPKPKVDSLIIVLERKDLWNENFTKLEKLTSCLFSQRNKKAEKVIKTCIDKENLIEFNVKGKRVKDLTPNEILNLLNT
jgi:16S rRNA (adenine1518-N6/adenine1519-N6)-dimethyltransferase